MGLSRHNQRVANIENEIDDIKKIMGEGIARTLDEQPSVEKEKLLTPTAPAAVTDEKSVPSSSSARVQRKLEETIKMADSLEEASKQFEKKPKPIDKKPVDNNKLQRNLLVAGSVAAGLLTAVGFLAWALKKSSDVSVTAMRMKPRL